MSIQKQLNIFFIHAQWLKDRDRVINEFQKLLTKYCFKNIKTKVHIITQYDPNDINADIISKTVNYDKIVDEDENISSENKLSFYNGLLKNLHIFQLSNALKHYKALEEISKSNENDINIILEDDILYEDKICMLLEKLISDLPSKYEILFLSLPSNIDRNKGIKYQNTKELFRILPYCNSYMMSTQTAKKMYENYLPIKYLNNIQLSYVLEKTKIESSLTIPSIFMDGSKYGLFLSVLNPNNILLFNNDYMKVKTLLEKNELTLSEKTDIEKILKETVIAANPDMIYLNALYNIKIEKYKIAESLFNDALKKYQAYNCILNNESQFLRDYIRLYKYLQ